MTAFSPLYFILFKIVYISFTRIVYMYMFSGAQTQMKFKVKSVLGIDVE